MGDRFGREHVSCFSTAFSIRPSPDADPVTRFASAILLRPFKVDKSKQNKNDPPKKELTEYEQQVELKRRLRTMLANEALIPRVRSKYSWGSLLDWILICYFICAGADILDKMSADDAGE
jgi:hypothetical protein